MHRCRIKVSNNMKGRSIVMVFITSLTKSKLMSYLPECMKYVINDLIIKIWHSTALESLTTLRTRRFSNR